MELESIIKQFLPTHNFKNCQQLGNGLIHKTFLIKTEKQSFILQNINQSVFNVPELLVRNHIKINQSLTEHHYDLKISNPIKTPTGNLVLKTDNQYWRMTEYIDDTQTFQKAESPELAYQAAKALSYFHLCLGQNKNLQLDDTLPNFINFEKRSSDFSAAKATNINRAKEVIPEILFLDKYKHLTKLWLDLTLDKRMQKRYIHADPKISNILFDFQEKAVAIIDLDTVLLGYILYDFGDMIRSYTNKTQEDDANISDNFDREIYKATKEGFLFHTDQFLTPLEKDHLDDAAKIVIYVQALRFLSDHIQGNIYYEVDYDGQNLHRAQNQINLLKGIMRSLDS